MKKTYAKSLIAIVTLVAISAVGFGTAFGYGGGTGFTSTSQGSISGQVLGASDIDWTNMSAADRAAIIQSLENQLAAIIKTLNDLIASGAFK